MTFSVNCDKQGTDHTVLSFFSFDLLIVLYCHTQTKTCTIGVRLFLPSHLAQINFLLSHAPSLLSPNLSTIHTSNMPLMFYLNEEYSAQDDGHDNNVRSRRHPELDE